MTTPALHHARLDAPLGELVLSATADALVAVSFHDERDVPDVAAPPRARARLLDRARRQLDAYFAGRRTSFDLPLDLRGSAFQRAVWAELSRLPYGTTTSYGAIARSLGRPTAARAVGAANGRNPLAIIVPCHRAIGSDGTLTGYAGGLPRKRWLLQHEAAHRRAAQACGPALDAGP